jgi:hypothetical protein
MITNIVYSNSDYFDALDVFIDEWNKYYNKDLIIFADKSYKNKQTIIYNKDLKYTDKLIQCLEQLNSNILLYQHEDMFLYDYPNQNKIYEYKNILENNEYSFIRLTKTGACNFSKNNLSKTLLNISPDSTNFFVIQSSLWKKNDLIKFLKQAGSLNMWDLEESSPIINSKINLQGLCHFDNEQKRGGHHDSNVWPYIATAIVKGKWNFSEYKIELEKIEKISNNQRDKI